MTCKELISVLSKPWLCVKDIQKVAQCGRDKASYIRDIITTNLTNNKTLLPCGQTKYIPTKSLIDYLNIDIEYIYDMAEKEKSLSL